MVEVELSGPEFTGASSVSFALPKLEGPVFTGKEFYSTIAGVTMDRREDAIFAEFERGNIPPFMAQLAEVKITSGPMEILLFVTPDVLCVGTDEDPARLPMWPGTAQRIADMLGCVLPTPQISDAIWKAAAVKLLPRSMTAGGAMTLTSTYEDHNAIIERALFNKGAKRGQLVAGHKKDIVIIPRMPAKKVVIYGWHQLNGVPIQGGERRIPNGSSHDDRYVDYSHGVRLVSKDAKLNGSPVLLAEMLRDPTFASILAGGVVDPPRYAV